VLLAGCTGNNTVTDIDGNIYRTVQIGDQIWMAENLRVTRYSNGDSIPNITDAGFWSHYATGARCYYNNDPNNGALYGCLYNWHVVRDKRSIAPTGWHLPDEEELAELMNTLEGDTIAAGKMKIKGLGGYRYGEDGSFHTLGSNGYWWSASRSYELFSWSARLFTGFADVGRHRRFENYGLAIRCIKNVE
jgi:uncharacterized protein (TIGR02145 family)